MFQIVLYLFVDAVIEAALYHKRLRRELDDLEARALAVSAGLFRLINRSDVVN